MPPDASPLLRRVARAALLPGLALLGAVAASAADYKIVTASSTGTYIQIGNDRRKSTTEIRPTVPQDKRKNGKGGKGGGGGGKGGNGAGVQKKQSKTKGGLKVLG